MARNTRPRNLFLRWAVTTFVLACGMAISLPAHADVSVRPATKGYDIDIEGQVSASELLNAISGVTGATIKGQPAETTINANHLRSTTLERALRQLLPGAAFTIRSTDDGTPQAIIFMAPAAEDGAVPDDGSSEDSGSTATQPVDPNLETAEPAATDSDGTTNPGSDTGADGTETQ